MGNQKCPCGEKFSKRKPRRKKNRQLLQPRGLRRSLNTFPRSSAEWGRISATVRSVFFSYVSASRPSCAADSCRLTVPTDRENQRLLKAVPCANAVHSWYCHGHSHPADTFASHSLIQRD